MLLYYFVDKDKLLTGCTWGYFPAIFVQQKAFSNLYLGNVG